DEEAARELLRRAAGELAVEAQHDEQLDAGGLDEPLLLLGGGEQRRRLARAQQLQRVRVEGDEGRRQAELAGPRDDAVEDGALPAVDAVEVADGGDHLLRQVTVPGILD